MKLSDSTGPSTLVSRTKGGILGASVLTLAALAACSSDNDRSPLAPVDLDGQAIYGIRGSAELIRFGVDAPQTVETLGTISSLGAGESIVGLDFRPEDGNLHAVTSAGRSLLVDPETAMATELQAIMGDGTMLTGNRIGVDFNPAANALRIIGDDGKNLRVPTAALVNPPSMDVSTLVDGVMGYRQGVTAAAYTFPFSVPEAPAAPTTLFVIDTENDVLYTQDANNGPLTLVGDLGVDATSANGYEIVEVGGTNEHYALLTVGTTTSLYSLDASTGEATSIGDLPDGTYKGMIIGQDDELAADERELFPLLESGSNYSTLSFVVNTTSNTLTESGPAFPIAGLPDGEELIGMDTRTTSMEAGNCCDFVVGRTGTIYLLETDPANENGDFATPVATLSTALSGTSFGVDFNPRADLLRIVSDTGQNLRVNLQADREIPAGSGEQRAAGFAFVDGTTRLVAPAPQVVATAYRATNPGMGNFQYALDARDSSLARVAVPNDGALVRVGALGVSLPVNGDGAAEQSLDIASTGDTELGLAALQTSGAALSTLYVVDLETGAATAVGPIGDSGVVNAITVEIAAP